MVFGLFRHADGRTDNRVRRSPYSHKGNIGESDSLSQQKSISRKLFMSKLGPKLLPVKHLSVRFQTFSHK